MKLSSKDRALRAERRLRDAQRPFHTLQSTTHDRLRNPNLIAGLRSPLEQLLGMLNAGLLPVDQWCAANIDAPESKHYKARRREANRLRRKLIEKMRGYCLASEEKTRPSDVSADVWRVHLSLLEAIEEAA